MKTRLSLFCIALLVLLSANVADAQLVNSAGSGVYGGGGLGLSQPAFQSFNTQLLQPGLPGRLWIEANFADRGLGYDGSYFTIGSKSRLFQDRLDGRWLFQGQFHHSIEDDGSYFGNIGLERVFTIDAAQTDVSISVHYDYDNDDQQQFSDGFHQWGVSGQLKTPNWDLIGNGYLPVGTEYYSLGDPTGETCFVGNRIALVPGLEAALEGFDVTLRTRPRGLAFVNGTFDVGAYHYASDVVESFAGGRLRLGMQIINGLIVSAEVNHDERFDTTGFLGVGLVFGSNASGYGSEYASLGRDLEQIPRNDHIVRFSQDVEYAIDPDTGMPYNVIHADNLADAAFADGTYETPFTNLADAEAASGTDDIIFVHGGDGTDRNYDTGITLKDRQFLLSNGGTQLIPLADGTLFQISGKPGESTATISNNGGNEVVRLANNNMVGGLNIDGTGANFGIAGAGVSGGLINGNNISGASFDGVNLTNITGDWQFTDNTITGNLQDGILINGVFDTTANFTFDSNNLSSNAVDGLHVVNYEAESIVARDNMTDSNGRHGLFLQNGIAAAGTDVSIVDHISDSNGGDGVRIDGGSGRLFVLNPEITNNSGTGLTIRNWVDPLADDWTFIGGVNGQTAVFTGNGTGISLELDGLGLVQDVVVTESQIDSNGRGLLASVQGAGSIMNLDILNMNSISNNDNEAIRMLVDNSGVINNRIENFGNAMAISGNNVNGGGTISYVLNGPGGAAASQINSVVRNVNVNTTAGGASGILVDEVGNSQINLDVADSTILAPAAVNINLDNNRNNLINRTVFDNVDIRGDIGILGNSEDGTLWDFALINSNVQSNGILAGAGEVLDPNNPGIYTPYLDTVGDFGVVINATGGGPVGSLFDNLTRVTMTNNVIRDFTFNGVVLTTNGDAQMLVDATANQILNNGPGLDDDPNGDGIFEGPNSLLPNPTEFGFHDGMVLQANDVSTLSARLSNNAITNSFERGLVLQTTGQGTINASMVSNRLSNDIGADLTNPVGIPLGANIFDMDVINATNGNICVGMSNNTFRLLPINFVNAGAAPSLAVGLDGATNGFTAADLPGTVTPVGFGLCDGLVTAEELFFQATGGFPVSAH